MVEGVPVGEDWDTWCEQAWQGPVPDPEDVGEVPASQRVPSGWAALELDQATGDPAGLSDAELIETIVGFDRVASWAGARQARLLAEFTRRRPPDDWTARRTDSPSRCSPFAADEVGLALRCSRTSAANRLALAEALVHDLPGTLAAWQAGQLDSPKVRAIADTAELLPLEMWARLEARVLPRAPQQTLALLRRSLLRAVLAIDPDGAERRHQARRRDRRVGVSPDGDGMATLRALLTASDATAAYEQLSRLARSLGATDPRPMDARRADLLADLLTGRRCAATGCTAACEGACEGACEASDPAREEGDPEGGEAGAGGGQCAGGVCGHETARPAGRAGKPLVQVIVPITMLMGLDEQPGELVGYGPIPASLARQIAAGGTWRRLLTDPESGTLLDHGRTTYVPPAGLADFVRVRDVYCRSPICGQSAARADLDHTVAWDDGGHTREMNLHAACRHDHLAKTHAPGWHVEQHDDGRITWTTPTGHRYTSHPHDYRADPDVPPDTDPDPPPF